MSEDSYCTINDFMESAKELAENLPTDDVRANVYFHKMFIIDDNNDRKKEYAILLRMELVCIDEDGSSRIGSVYDRIWAYVDLDKLWLKERQSQSELSYISKRIQDYNVPVSNFPEFLIENSIPEHDIDKYEMSGEDVDHCLNLINEIQTLKQFEQN